MTDFIEVYDNALTTDFCQKFIKQFDSSKHQTPGLTGGGLDKTKKHSKDIYLNEHEEFYPALQTVLQATTHCLKDYISKYIFSLIGGISLTLNHPTTGKPAQLTVENFAEVGEPNIMNLIQYLFRLDPINAQKYDKGIGNYSHWHSEIYPQPNENKSLHRVLLFLIYLNDVEEGGETEFYHQKRIVKPKAGSIVIAPCGFTHTHRGNIPISNDKYVLTSWMLYNPAEKIYTK
ncbi:2OG-Fe(II) oxygenase [Thalassomonas sp. M1454]|uniref:2OG-Fe(II) oxygenase n=1 Tax=Thalassomonas sp. M1454 TaxID=2594477 RepID=UPI001180D923|nr:2OG-Fe(II) oxygenase [Thalassomonas sp. M1454]TRX52480.1 2OG-Fe(II) oxygenase [Thalassomonas sp. M1454]